MSVSFLRDKAFRQAVTDFDSALHTARGIDDPWYRCQALAGVAHHAPDDRTFFALVDKALESGWSIEVPNRSVSVNAWPVAALAQRRFSGPEMIKRAERELDRALDRALTTIAREPNPTSRADALLLQVHALSPSQARRRRRVLDRLVSDCRKPSDRKRQRQLRERSIEEAALAIAADDPRAAAELASMLKEARRLRTIDAIEGRSEVLGPRSFFHNS